MLLFKIGDVALKKLLGLTAHFLHHIIAAHISKIMGEVKINDDACSIMHFIPERFKKLSWRVINTSAIIIGSESVLANLGTYKKSDYEIEINYTQLLSFIVTAY